MKQETQTQGRGKQELLARLQLQAEVHPSRKVDVGLPGKGISNSHGARPVHLIITMIKWVRTSRLSIKNSRSLQPTAQKTTGNTFEPELDPFLRCVPGNGHVPPESGEFKKSICPVLRRGWVRISAWCCSFRTTLASRRCGLGFWV